MLRAVGCGTFMMVLSMQGAVAQTTIRLSGAIDVGVRNVGIAAGDRAAGQWLMQTGGSPRSAISFSGSEELGNRLKAVFWLNHRFNPDDGTLNTRGYENNGPVGSTQFWRESHVGLEGPFGDVRLGRIRVPLHELNGSFEPWNGGDTVATVHTGGLLTPPRTNNTIYFRSPKLSGWQVHASVAGREGQTSANGQNTTGPERPYGVGVKFDHAHFSFALAGDRSDKDVTTIGLFGRAAWRSLQLLTQIERGDRGMTLVNGHDQKNTRASLSAKWAVDAFVWKLGYLRMQDEQMGDATSVYAPGKHVDKVGFGADYGLSRRTFLYSDVSKRWGDASPASRRTQFDLGILHRF